MSLEQLPQTVEQLTGPNVTEKYRNLAERLSTRLGRVAAAGLLIAGATLSAETFEPPARADSISTTYDDLGYPWKDAPCGFGSAGGPSCVNPAAGQSWDRYDWGEYDAGGRFQPYRNGAFEYRNCTDYAAWRITQLGGMVSGSLGNGGQWYDNAPANMRSLTPRAGEAAVVPGNPGHVAFVESVNSVDPNNAGNDNITVSEYNHDAQGHGDYRTGRAADMDFREYVDFGVHPAGESKKLTSGNLLQVANTGDGWSSSNLTDVDGVKIAGKPAVLWTPDGPAVFAVDADGKLEEFTICAYGNSWCVYPITEANALAGGVTATFNTQNGDMEVFGPSTDGSLLQIEGNGSSWHSYNLTAAAGNLHIEGAPGVIWNGAGPDIFAVSSSGILTQFTTCPDGSGWCTYGILPDDKLSGGADVAHVGSSIDVFARSVGGHLYQIENPGDGWSMYDITTAAGRVNVQGTPGVFWSSAGPNVFISDSSGRLTQFAMCPRGGWCTYPLTDPGALGEESGVSATLEGGSIELFADSKPY